MSPTIVKEYNSFELCNFSILTFKFEVDSCIWKNVGDYTSDLMSKDIQANVLS